MPLKKVAKKKTQKGRGTLSTLQWIKRNKIISASLMNPDNGRVANALGKIARMIGFGR